MNLFLIDVIIITNNNILKESDKMDYGNINWKELSYRNLKIFTVIRIIEAILRLFGINGIFGDEDATE